MSHVQPVVDSRSLVSVTAVLALHLVALYVLQTGLTDSLIGSSVDPIEATLIDEPSIEPREPPPPPRLRAVPVDTVPMPEIAIELPAESSSDISSAVAAVRTRVIPRSPTVTVVPPRIDRGHSNIMPEYPPTSKRLGEQGRVLVRVLILENGSAAEVQVVQSSGFPRLDAAAVEHVQRDWRFVPAQLDGQAIAAWGRFGVTFQIMQ